MKFIKNIGLIFLLLFPLLTFAQNSFFLKGYVVDENNIYLSDITVTRKGKRFKTNLKGEFKFFCSLNDTLKFTSNSGYAPLNYVVKDNILVVVKLTKEVKYSKGKRMLSYSIVNTYPKHSLNLLRTFYDDHSINLGYTYFLNPFLNKNSSQQNLYGLGINVSLHDKNYILLPCATFDLKDSYKIKYSYLSLLLPEISVGYYFDVSDYNRYKGFGYNLKLELLTTSVKKTNLSLIISYDNYSISNGAVMLGLKVTYNEPYKFKLKIKD